MIRFVDVRNQGICSRFSFWDTIIEKFIEIEGEQAWHNWNDFIEVAENYDALGRLKRLCPEWVFDDSEDDIEAFYDT